MLRKLVVGIAGRGGLVRKVWSALAYAAFISVVAAGCHGPSQSTANYHSRPQNATKVPDRLSMTHSEKSVERVIAPTMSAEVLYVRQMADLCAWDLCLLHIPSGKVTVLAGSQKPISFSTGIGSEAVFSPDGQCVLFAATAKGWKYPANVTQYSPGNGELLDLWIYDRRNSHLTRLTTDSQGYQSLKWSPDGQYVSAHGMRAWTTPEIPPTEAGAPHDDLIVWDIKSRRHFTVVNDVNNEQWMPNSRGLLTITSDWHLYRWIARNRQRSLMSGNVNKAVWMPDSKGILFTTDKPGLYLTRILDKAPTVFHAATTNMYAPVWSPDGTQLAYLEGVNIDRHIVWKVNILRISDKSLRTLMQLSNEYSSLIWSPDGTKLAIATIGLASRNESDNTKVYIADLASQMLSSPHIFEGNAKVLGWTSDGKTAIIIETAFSDKIPESLIAYPKKVSVMGISADISRMSELAIVHATPTYPQISFMDWRPAGK